MNAVNPPSDGCRDLTFNLMTTDNTHIHLLINPNVFTDIHPSTSTLNIIFFKLQINCIHWFGIFHLYKLIFF